MKQQGYHHSRMTSHDKPIGRRRCQSSVIDTSDNGGNSHSHNFVLPCGVILHRNQLSRTERRTDITLTFTIKKYWTKITCQLLTNQLQYEAYEFAQLSHDEHRIYL